jgi:hypothetical protein
MVASLQLARENRCAAVCPPAAFSQQNGQVALQLGGALAKWSDSTQSTTAIEQEYAGGMVEGIASVPRGPLFGHQLQLADQSCRRLGVAAQPDDRASARRGESGNVFLEHRQCIAIRVEGGEEHLDSLALRR